MPVPGLSFLGLKRIRGFVSILRYINPTIIIINMTLAVERDVKQQINLSYLVKTLTEDAETGILSLESGILRTCLNVSMSSMYREGKSVI